MNVCLCFFLLIIHLLHSAESSGEAAQRIGGYLDALATGSALSGGAGIASHVNALGSSTSLSGSASAVKSYLDSMSSGSVVAPSAPAVQNYLEDVSSGAASTPTSGGGIASYIGALSSTNVLSGGAGIATHVNGLGSATQLSGAGMPSYLDVVGGVSSAPVVSTVAPISNGATAPASVANGAAAPSSYMKSLASTNVLSGGAGIASHVNNLGSATQVSGTGIPSYLDNVNQEDKAILEGEIFNQVFSNKVDGSTAPNETTTVDTQVSHNGDQTTITTTTVTTVIVNEPVYA